MTASSTYKETHRYMNSVIDTLNVDVDRALVEVCMFCLSTVVVGGVYVFSSLLQKNLASAGKWSFDIFAFRRISEGHNFAFLNVT